MIKPIPVEKVTDDLMKDFFRAYWQECGAHEEDYMIDGYVDQALAAFRYAMKEKQAYCDGVRWDVMTYRKVNGASFPTGVWPHVKVRFKVQDPMDGTPYEKQLFTFVIYGNSVSSIEMHTKVKPAVADLVDRLKERFPVVAEA